MDTSGGAGSLVCGDRAFIDEVYRMRKRLGGAMRQAGVVAAAGIVALEQMVERLADELPEGDRAGFLGQNVLRAFGLSDSGA